MVALCSASARTLATRAWTRASRAALLRRPADPGCFRECARDARRSFRRPARSGFGPATSISRPRSSTAVSRVLTPRSTPTAVPGLAWRSGDVALYFDGERHEPPLRASATPWPTGSAPCRPRSCAAACRWTRGCAMRRAGEASPSPRSQRIAPVEPERVPGLPALLEPREPEPLSLALALPRLDEVAQRPVQVPERLLVSALGVLRPPGKAPGRPSSPRSTACAARPPSTTSARPRTAPGTWPGPSSRRTAPRPHATAASAPEPGSGRARTGTPALPSPSVSFPPRLTLREHGIEPV